MLIFTKNIFSYVINAGIFSLIIVRHKVTTEERQQQLFSHTHTHTFFVYVLQSKLCSFLVQLLQVLAQVYWNAVVFVPGTQYWELLWPMTAGSLTTELRGCGVTSLRGRYQATGPGHVLSPLHRDNIFPYIMLFIDLPQTRCS